jgi:hypothetical protein
MKQIDEKYLDKISIKFSERICSYVMKNFNKSDYGHFNISGFDINNSRVESPFIIDLPNIYFYYNVNGNLYDSNARYYDDLNKIVIHLYFNKTNKKNILCLKRYVLRFVRHELQHFMQYIKQNDIFNNCSSLEPEDTTIYLLQPHEIDAFISEILLWAKINKKSASKEISSFVKRWFKNGNEYVERKYREELQKQKNYLSLSN